MNIKALSISLALLASTALPASAAHAQQQAPAAKVEVAEASDDMMAPQSFLPATVISQNDSRISAEIAGRVTWIAPEGSLVEEGDVVATIDDRRLTLKVQRANSQVSRLKARIDFLEKDLARVSELAGSSAVSVRRLQEAEAELAMTREELVQAKVAYEEALVSLDSTEVRAPFPGRVVSRLAQIGEYSNPGSQLVRLVDTENLEVTAMAPVTLAGILRDGQNAVLRDGELVSDTQIRAIVPVGDARSRSMELRINLPQSTAYVVGAALQVGVSSRTPEQVITVPRDALVLRREGTYVFRVKDDNTVERLMITTGSATGQSVAVLGDLKKGDRVVIRGGERLRPGQAIELSKLGVSLTAAGR